MDLGEELADVWKVVGRGTAGDDVEGGFRIGDTFGVYDFESNVFDAAFRGDGASLFEHAVGDIGCDDCFAELCDGECREAGSGSEIDAKLVASERSPLGQDAQTLAGGVRNTNRVVRRVTVELLLCVGRAVAHDRCCIMNSTVRSIDVVAAFSS